MSGYGDNTVQIRVDFADGRSYTLTYGHMESASVTQGQHVSEGDAVGIIGDEGNSTNKPHLHFEVSIGKWSVNGPRVDPAIWLNNAPKEYMDYSQP